MSDHEKIMKALESEAKRIKRDPKYAREALVSAGIMRKDGKGFTKHYKELESLCKAVQPA